MATKAILFVGVVLLSSSQVQSNIVIESENVTKWGEWGPWDNCPKGSYASSFRLKAEMHHSSVKLDDTGLNGIELFCSKLDDAKANPVGSIVSIEGDFGDWGIKFRCGSGSFINGFQMRSLEHQGAKDKSGSGSSMLGLQDDYGATNLRVFCSGQTTELEGDGLDKGEWERRMSCLDDQYVCGIQTQVEFPEEREQSYFSSFVDQRWIGYGDNTALNNVRMQCCDIPNPAATCKPSDKWEMVLSCDATMRASAINCKYDKTVGVSKGKATATGQHEGEGSSTGGSKGIGVALSFLSANFGENYGKSKSTGHDWSNSASGTFNEATTTTTDFIVQPGQLTKLYQLVGTCGDFVVRTSEMSAKDFDKDGNILG